MRRALAHLLLVVGGIAAGVGLLIGAELTLRLLDVGSETRVFEPTLDADGTSIMRLRWNPQYRRVQRVEPYRQFRADKSSGTFRIFVIGESSAAGVPYGTPFAFSSWLARRLTAQAPEVRWEVVNAALAGAVSWSMLTVVRDIARYEPDLLVIYLGHNEVGTLFSAAERRWLDPRRISLRARLGRSRLYRILLPMIPARMVIPELDLKAVHRPGEAFAVIPPGGTRRYATAADRSLSAALYRSRLEEMVRTMRSAGARTMLLTLSQNFSEWEPLVSSHRPGMRPDEKAAWRAAVKEGDALAAHDCTAALAAWTRAFALDDGHAALQFKMARCEQALGRLEGARARFRLAGSLDRLRHGAYLNDIVRDVAQREGTLLVDVDALLTRASGARLVGGDLFVDSHHPNMRAHQLIAAAVANAIREARLPGPAVRWTPQAYLDPDPGALLAANPGLQAKELMSRALACHAAGRPGCSLPTLAEAARRTPDPATRRMLEKALQTPR